MTTTKRSRADFLSALVFFILGIWMALEGTKMPGPEEVSYIEAGGEPGRVPILLGAIIATFSLILLIRSVREGGYRVFKRFHLHEDERVGVIRSCIAVVICSVYAVGMVGATIAGWKVPYALSTAVFVFVFIVGFEWGLAKEHGRVRWAGLQTRWPKLADSLSRMFAFIPPDKAGYVWLIVTAALQAVIVSLVVTYVFEREFYVTLP